MKLTFLGTGTSFGVPMIGCTCAVCRSEDSRDSRTRCGVVVEVDSGERLLIDTPPELRMQLIATGIDHVDAIAFTHDHADHVHGIDDIRAFTVRQDTPLPLYGEGATLQRLAQRFPYVFDPSLRPMPGTSKPEGEPRPLSDGSTFALGGASVEAIAVPHGHVTVFGYRIGRLAYITDAKTIDARVVERLRDVDVLVLNALFRRQHPTHLSIAEAVEAARAVGARQTYFTHLTHETSHEELLRELPAGITPAYDGLEVIIQ